MRAVVIPEPGSVGVERLDDPVPQPGEVVVAPDACGLCGTDLHLLDGELEATLYPIVPGHEFCGEVVALGAQVSGLRMGDVVAVEPNLTCGSCAFCRAGRENLCERWAAIGVSGANGAAAELTAVPARNAVVLPEGFPRECGVLVEPLSCAVHGFDLLDLRLADDILIYGAGTMGLMLCQLAAHQAAGSVSLVDRNPSRLGRAAALGADFTATAAQDLDRDGGWEIVIDATGAVAAIEDGLSRVRRGGTMLLFGVAAADATATFSPFRLYRDEIRVIGSMAVLHSFERAVRLLQRGVIDAGAMLTHTVALGDYADGVATFRRGEGLKIQVAPAA